MSAVTPVAGKRVAPPGTCAKPACCRPAVEVADILRAQGNRFLDRLFPGECNEGGSSATERLKFSSVFLRRR